MSLARIFCRLHGYLQPISKARTPLVSILKQKDPTRIQHNEKHGLHTATQSTSCQLQLQEECLELSYGGLLMHFDYVWLRDHCRSASCYNSKTNQRNLDTANVELNIHPTNYRLDDENIYLTWPDGHVTKYNLSWLAKNSYEGQKQSAMQPRIIWNSDIYTNANVPSASWDKFMTCDEELKKFLCNFLLYGIAFVEDVPSTLEATENVSRRVSLIRCNKLLCYVRGEGKLEGNVSITT